MNFVFAVDLKDLKSCLWIHLVLIRQANTKHAKRNGKDKAIIIVIDFPTRRMPRTSFLVKETQKNSNWLIEKKNLKTRQQEENVPELKEKR